MKCVICDKSIPRGQRFIGDRYKTIKFCCEECYKQYCKQKDESKQNNKKQKDEKEKSEWRDMTDYISKIYPPDTINWMIFTKQIKSLMEKYELTCKEVKLTIKYAIEYEDYVTRPEYGIGQFIPKFVEPMREFRNKLSINKTKAKSQTLNNFSIFYVKKASSKNNYNKKLEEFDDE